MMPIFCTRTHPASPHSLGVCWHRILINSILTDTLLNIFKWRIDFFCIIRQRTTERFCFSRTYADPKMKIEIKVQCTVTNFTIYPTTASTVFSLCGIQSTCASYEFDKFSRNVRDSVVKIKYQLLWCKQKLSAIWIWGDEEMRRNGAWIWTVQSND